MPTYEITTPDGKVFEIETPSQAPQNQGESPVNATREQLIERGRQIEMRKQLIERGRQIEQGRRGREYRIQEPLPLGLDELNQLKKLGEGIASFLGGPPGTPAPAPEFAPPGMAEMMGLPPNVQRAAVATGGAMLAGPLASATGLPIIAAEPIAAAGGELAAQAIIGKSEPINLLLAAGLPFALRGIFRAGLGTAKFIGKRLPGAAAGLQERAAAMGRALIEKLRPSDVEGLKLSAKSLDNLDVPLNHFRQTAQDVLDRADKLVPRLRPSQATSVIKQIDDLIATTQNQALPLRTVRDNLEEIGAEIGRLRRATGDHAGLVRGASRNYRAYRQVYKSILKDIDALPADASETLQHLRKTLRNDFAVSDLEAIIEKGIDQRAVDGLTYIKARQMRNAWLRGRDSQYLRESFSRADRAIIDEYMDEIIKLPTLPRPQGVASGPTMASTRLAGAGGIVGALAGPTAGAAAAGVAAIAPRVISRAMMSEPGRNALIRLLRTQQPLTAQSLELLASVSRQAAQTALQPSTAP